MKMSTTFLRLSALGLGLFLLSSCATDIATPSDRFAIVIGVQSYLGGYDLDYPDDDAADMKALLEERGWTVTATLINSSDTTLVSNGTLVADGSTVQDATYANIEAAIADLASQSGFDSDSTVLVYYSGHGSTDSSYSTAYMIPYDGISSTGASVASNWITPATMSQWLGTLDCSNKMLILDSCYSGGFVDTSSSTDTIPQSYGEYEGGTEEDTLSYALSNFGSLLAASVADDGDPSVLTIAAAGSEEYSYDGDDGHGVFTEYLLDAADSGDDDGDGYVTATEAYAYAKDAIDTYWNADYESSSGMMSLAEWYYMYYGYVPDFMPHISGGNGDLVLYAK